MIKAWHRSNEASRRLDDIPGVGPALATALVASVADPTVFRSGRDFSAWMPTARRRWRCRAAKILCLGPRSTVFGKSSDQDSAPENVIDWLKAPMRCG
jgi:hypothetical protein